MKTTVFKLWEQMITAKFERRCTRDPRDKTGILIRGTMPHKIGRAKYLFYRPNLDAIQTNSKDMADYFEMISGVSYTVRPCEDWNTNAYCYEWRAVSSTLTK